MFHKAYTFDRKRNSLKYQMNRRKCFPTYFYYNVTSIDNNSSFILHFNTGFDDNEQIECPCSNHQQNLHLQLLSKSNSFYSLTYLLYRTSACINRRFV